MSLPHTLLTGPANQGSGLSGQEEKIRSGEEESGWVKGKQDGWVVNCDCKGKLSSVTISGDVIVPVINQDVCDFGVAHCEYWNA